MSGHSDGQTAKTACSPPASELFAGAPIVDFSGWLRGIDGIVSESEFGPRFVELVRDPDAPRAVVIVDRALSARWQGAFLVRDHINLSGDNPLVGPNHPCGPRFPVVQGVYFTEAPGGLDRAVAGGLRKGVVPDADDVGLLRSFAVDFLCYNIVPAMLVAAHAGRRVLALGLSDSAALTPEQVEEIAGLTGRTTSGKSQ